MKKKGMIPEHHRKASEEKWDRIIKAIDDGEKWGKGKFHNSVSVTCFCGYCFDALGRQGTLRGAICNFCKISVKICSCIYPQRDAALFWKFVCSMDEGDRTKARKIAVKIRDYIKNDKPKERNDDKKDMSKVKTSDVFILKEKMMKKVISTEKVPIKLWLEDIEDGAFEQAKNLANLPFVFKHIAIMPDCHQGYGMPIGGVMATKGVVVPNAVGVDIGCGMCAVKTPWNKMTDSKLRDVMISIREAIPLGFKKHSSPRDTVFMPKGYAGISLPIVEREYANARVSLGTLGGGNHFIEIQKGSDGYIWVMIHSGSRNLGKKVADHYNSLAIALNQKYYSEVTKEVQLAFLPLDSDEGKSYMDEMRYCVDFAFANRKYMMDRVCDILNCDSDGMINVAHNYATMENHYDQNVLVHRKGATLAREGIIGIIPGSQGTASYIVEGKGNPLSFNSCSHGAGRTMGRKQAQREINLEAEIRKLDDLGVIHSIRGKSDLDEASGAYKDIDMVMENQSDLVDIIEKLTPIAVIKG